MRFNRRVTFVKETEGYYDPKLGQYIDGALVKVTKPCNVSRLGLERTNELFGQFDRVITVIRLQRPYEGNFDYLYLDGNSKQKLTMQRRSDYRKGVFYVEGGS